MPFWLKPVSARAVRKIVRGGSLAMKVKRARNERVLAESEREREREDRTLYTISAQRLVGFDAELARIRKRYSQPRAATLTRAVRARAGHHRALRLRQKRYTTRVSATRARPSFAEGTGATDVSHWPDLNTSLLCVSALEKPALSIGEWAAERDRCSDPAYRSPHFIMREGFWENTDRLKDAVSVHLGRQVRRLSRLPGGRLHAFRLVLLTRFLSSPRDAMGPMAQACAGAIGNLRSFVLDAPTGCKRHTYHMVFSRVEVAAVLDPIARALARRSSAKD
ncbi:unnamed protein product, partial [Prorocentrum cordatum]